MKLDNQTKMATALLLSLSQPEGCDLSALVEELELEPEVVAPLVAAMQQRQWVALEESGNLRLTADPEELTLCAILEAADPKPAEENGENGRVHHLHRRLDDSARGYFSHVTLADLIQAEASSG